MNHTETLTQFVHEYSVCTVNDVLTEIMEVHITLERSDADHPILMCEIDALCDDNPVESIYSKTLPVDSDGKAVFPDNKSFLDSIYECISTEYHGHIVNENIQSRFEALLNGEDASDFDTVEVSLVDIAFGLPRTGFVPDNTTMRPRLEEPVFDIISTGEIHCQVAIRVGTDFADDVAFYMDVPNNIQSLEDPLPADTQLEVIKNIFNGSLESIRNYRPFRDILY